MNEVMKTALWQQLAQHSKIMKKKSLAELFACDSERFQKFSLTEAGLTIDYSKNPITERTLDLLYQLADALQLRQHICDLFSGQCVNTTQQLPALHTALRDPRPSGLIVSGSDILVKIHAALEKMSAFVINIQEQKWRGATGQAMTDIVNIGIGGSHLGPLMAVKSLKSYQHPCLRIHFISHQDSHSLDQRLKQLNAEMSTEI